MRRIKGIIASGFVALFVIGSAGSALGAGDAGDDQGYCKKQGSSACAGQSECSTAHRENLPPGKRKRCS